MLLTGFNTPGNFAHGLNWAQKAAIGYEVATTGYGAYESTRNLLNGCGSPLDALSFLPLAGFGLSKLDNLRGVGGLDDSARVLENKAARDLTSPNVEKYWNEYYDTVGKQGDNLQSLIDQAKSKGISIVEDATQATYNLKTKEILVSNDTKKWEFFEEFLHKKVNEEGWKKGEISDLTKQLRKVKDFRRRKQVKAPASAAEEIVVKTWLKNHGKLVGAGDAEKTLLQNQINQLRNYGMGKGY
ncbi:MAG: hypothetical protein ACRC2S_06055 [Waterburya sp.]